MSLGRKITQLRKKNKMSQEDFAEIFNVTRQTISSWENSKSYPDIETLIKMSDRFEISLDILLKGDIEMVKDIDKKVKERKKLIYVVLILVLFIFGIFLIGFQIKESKIRKQQNQFNKIKDNLSELGFDKRDGIGYSRLVEDGVTYKVYMKMPDALDKMISASFQMNDVLILSDFNGNKVGVTYVDDGVITVYCNRDGTLINDNQSKKNKEKYEKYQRQTTNLISRMTVLFDEIYR